VHDVINRANPLAALNRETLVAALRESYAGPAWHGPSVREALNDVSTSVASRRLGSRRNSIWELVLHLAHGRYLLTERIANRPAAPFPRAIREPWWPVAPSDSREQSWRDDLSLLEHCHITLIEAIERATAEQLSRMPDGGEPIAHQLFGLALHDAYHAGQIRLIALGFSDRESSR
jgi:uncharacterized damage-inducible protein DinB